MSGASFALQRLIYDRLVSDAGVTSWVGPRVYDAPGPDVSFPFISFGASDTLIEDADCIASRVETLQIDCWSMAEDGKRECKALVDAVKRALHDWHAEPDGAALVSLRVVMLRVFGDANPAITHGVVQVEAILEEDPDGD